MEVCDIDAELKCLIKDLNILLTGGIGKLELTDEAWCSLFNLTMDDFYYYLHMWVIDNKFTSFFGKDMNTLDLCLSLTTASFDYELTLAQAYSEDAGLSSRGGRYELKKDFVELEDGKQVYTIPANRQVKKVLFVTPSQIDHALFSSWGYGNMGLNQFAGVGSLGGLSFGGGINGGMIYPLLPSHDVMLRASHFNLTDRILNSELTFRITKGPNGTRLLHLFSVPTPKRGLRRELYSCKVWYEYYDTSNMTDQENQDCLEDCKKIYAPTQIDLPKQKYCDLNHWAKTWIRKWLTAYAKESLGRARGKFKGVLPNIGGESLELDWDIMLAEAKEEFDSLKTEITEFLDKLRSDNQLERRANEANSLNTVLKYTRLGINVI